MPFTPSPPTHHCAVCGKALWANRWKYAACQECGRKPCRHGFPPGRCYDCDAEGDRAYDAAKGN